MRTRVLEQRPEVADVGRRADERERDVVDAEGEGLVEVADLVLLEEVEEGAEAARDQVIRVLVARATDALPGSPADRQSCRRSYIHRRQDTGDHRAGC